MLKKLKIQMAFQVFFISPQSGLLRYNYDMLTSQSARFPPPLALLNQQIPHCYFKYYYCESGASVNSRHDHPCQLTDGVVLRFIGGLGGTACFRGRREILRPFKIRSQDFFCRRLQCKKIQEEADKTKEISCRKV